MRRSNSDDMDVSRSKRWSMRRRESKYGRSYSMPPGSLKSVMRFSTLDESLHSQYGSERDFDGSNSFLGGESLASLSDNTARSIHFGEVHIREYNRTVGDNPSCSAGPPVSISWEYDSDTKILTVEEYEGFKSKVGRRGSFELIIPRSIRAEMLRKEWGVPQSEIASAVRRNVRIKTQRRTTVNNLGKATKLEETTEKFFRKVKRMIFFRKSTSALVRQLEAEFERAEAMRAKLFLEQTSMEESSCSNSKNKGDIDTGKSGSSTIGIKVPVVADENDSKTDGASSSSLTPSTTDVNGNGNHSSAEFESRSEKNCSERGHMAFTNPETVSSGGNTNQSPEDHEKTDTCGVVIDQDSTDSDTNSSDLCKSDQESIDSDKNSSDICKSDQDNNDPDKNISDNSIKNKNKNEKTILGNDNNTENNENKNMQLKNSQRDNFDDSVAMNNICIINNNNKITNVNIKNHITINEDDCNLNLVVTQ